MHEQLRRVAMEKDELVNIGVTDAVELTCERSQMKVADRTSGKASKLKVPKSVCFGRKRSLLVANGRDGERLDAFTREALLAHRA